MINRQAKINIIKDILTDTNTLSSTYSPLLMERNQEKLSTICTRIIGLSQETFGNNNKYENKMRELVSQFPIVNDAQWQSAKDKLKLVLTEIWDFLTNYELEKFNFWNIIHNTITEASKEKFEDGHYADSVESSLKAVNKRVKEIVQTKTGIEYDGKDLMFKAFGFNQKDKPAPIIILDDLSSETGRNIQEGYMHLFAGAMQGIRNPKAHNNLIIARERAIHLIFLASLLMNKLDEAKNIAN